MYNHCYTFTNHTLLTAFCFQLYIVDLLVSVKIKGHSILIDSSNAVIQIGFGHRTVSDRLLKCPSSKPSIRTKKSWPSNVDIAQYVPSKVPSDGVVLATVLSFY